MNPIKFKEYTEKVIHNCGKKCGPTSCVPCPTTCGRR